MLDLGNIPSQTKAIQQIFYAGAPTVATSWQVWNKPRGVSFIHLFVLGGGGGGGGGVLGAASTAAGGGGGASSTQTSMIIPAFALPDVLYVSVGVGGAGGAGGAAGASGSAGVASIVSISNKRCC